jgi:acetolactate synthase-1/2/3 large subunit
MNGAQLLLRTMVDSGIEMCFTNPGTSEMHFVAALDSVPEMGAMLALFEGVATGAADGYARMADRPAAVLLHLGPGLGNGLANLHNARRAGSPVMVVVGDHATYHKRLDPPLESDIDTVARNFSSLVRRSVDPTQVAADAADVVAAAAGPPPGPATLVLPADVSWSDAPDPGRRPAVAVLRAPRSPAAADLEAAAAALRSSGGAAAIVVGGRGCRMPSVQTAARIAAATGARLVAEMFPPRMERGGGRPEVSRLAYLAELAAAQLEGVRHLMLVGAPLPVSFFAYPERPNELVPPGCQVHALVAPGQPTDAVLDALAEAVGAGPRPLAYGRAAAPGPAGGGWPPGPLTPESAAAVIGARLREGAIVVDEALTSGVHLPAATAGSPPHDWLTLPGGAIGMGPPAALGAAVACPDRPVLSLQADGSAMYTLQAWWSMARAGANVTTVVFANRSYAILGMELSRVGAQPGGSLARDMLDLGRPDLDFVSLAGGMGVPASRATTAEELATALDRALAEPGPALVEAVMPAFG